MLTRNKQDNMFQVFFTDLDSLVPQNHYLRLIDEFIDWNFIYPLVEPLYADCIGRPSIDPVVLIKIFFIQYLEGIPSVRKTVRAIEENIVFRWFLKIGLNSKVPHFSTISKNYYRRFKGTNLFKQIFEHILNLAIENNLIEEEVVFVDASHIKACANPHKFKKAYSLSKVDDFQEKIDQELEEAINQDRLSRGRKPLKPNKEKEKIDSHELIQTVEQIQFELNQLEVPAMFKRRKELSKEAEENLTLKESLRWIRLNKYARKGEHCKVTPPLVLTKEGELTAISQLPQSISLDPSTLKKTSTSDQQSGWFHKGEHRHVFAYNAQTVCDKHGFILTHILVPANYHDSKSFFGLDLSSLNIKVLVADAAYKNAKVVHWLEENDIEGLFPYKRPMTKEGFFKKYEFVYDEYYDCYICPNAKILKYNRTDRNGYKIYKSNPQDCRNCPDLDHCTESQNTTKVINRHIWAEELEKAEENRFRKDIKDLYQLRQETIERDFGICKERHNMRYTNYVGLEQVDAQVNLTFAAFNLKKIITVLFSDKL